MIDTIRTVTTHQQDCVDNATCLVTKSCGITENHISLCTSIINALSSLQTGNQPLQLNSEDRTKTTSSSTTATTTNAPKSEENNEINIQNNNNNSNDNSNGNSIIVLVIVVLVIIVIVIVLL